MKNANYVKTGSSGGLPVSFVAGIFVLFAIVVGINLVFVSKPWLDKFNMYCVIAAPPAIIGLLLLYLFNPAVRRVLTSKNTVQIHPLYSGTQNFIQKRVPSSAVRPEVYGESYNAKVCKQSTNQRLKIIPIWYRHAIAVVVSLCLISVLILIAAIKSVSPDHPEFQALVPKSELLLPFASIDPGFKFFIYLFGSVCLMIMLNTLRKSLRQIDFDRTANFCTITNQWWFGCYKRGGESFPLAEIRAMQLIEYTDREAATKYTAQTGKKRSFSSKRPIYEYEINLVKRDGTRVNIVNHRYKKGVLRVAARLHDWLGVPVIGNI